MKRWSKVRRHDLVTLRGVELYEKDRAMITTVKCIHGQFEVSRKTSFVADEKAMELVHFSGKPARRRRLFITKKEYETAFNKLYEISE